MRISDWSSDVCSSDLTVAVSGHDAPTLPPHPGMMSDLGALVGDGGSDQPARPNVISTLVPPPSRAQSSKRPPLASAVRRTMSITRPVDTPALTPLCSGAGTLSPGPSHPTPTCGEHPLRPVPAQLAPP